MSDCPLDLRTFAPADLPHLFSICLQTGDNGRDASEGCTDPHLLGDYFATPYAAFDSTLCLMLVDARDVPCGYVLGAVDTREYVEWFNENWLPALRETYRDVHPAPGARDAWVLDLLQEDAEVPPWVDDYPAHLHIDLLPAAQGRGYGRAMIDAWMHLAHERGAGGVHLGVSKRNRGALKFYEHVGLQPLQDLPEARIYGLSFRETLISSPR